MGKKIDKWPPQLTADRAFEVADKIYRGYGKSVNVGLLPDILDCKRKSSNFAKRLFALQTFKLATVANEVLTLTPLALRIVAPVSESEKRDAKTESILAIHILADLFNRFPGGHLPEKSMLKNLLQREYEIPEVSVVHWADFATRSIQAVKSRAQQVIENSTLTTEQKVEELLDGSEEPARVTSPQQTEPENMMKVPLAGDRFILIPKDLKDSEADYFKKWYEMWKGLHEEQ